MYNATTKFSNDIAFITENLTYFCPEGEGNSMNYNQTQIEFECSSQGIIVNTTEVFNCTQGKFDII